MGLKDKIFGKMLNKMLGGVDIKEIQQNASNGKYDVNKMLGVVEKMIGKKASDDLIRQIQEKASKGENINFSSIINIIKTLDLSKIEQQTADKNVDLKEMQGVLKDIVGEQKSKDLLKKAEEVAEEIAEEDAQNHKK